MIVERRHGTLSALANLPAPAPDVTRDARIRARCHAALTARARRPQAAVPPARRVMDQALAAAVVVYGVVVLVEGLRAAGVL
jgi:hypothetical protein